jgi:hypothetical protein
VRILLRPEQIELVEDSRRRSTRARGWRSSRELAGLCAGAR